MEAGALGSHDSTQLMCWHARVSTIARQAATACRSLHGFNRIETCAPASSRVHRGARRLPCNPAHVALTTGASEGVKRTLVADPRAHDAILIPRPQYPLYSASVTMAGGRAAYYDLNESHSWTVGSGELARTERRSIPLRPRAAPARGHYA